MTQETLDEFLSYYHKFYDGNNYWWVKWDTKNQAWVRVPAEVVFVKATEAGSGTLQPGEQSGSKQASHKQYLGGQS